MSTLTYSILFWLLAMVWYGLGDVFSKRPSRAIWALPTLVYKNFFVVLVTICVFFLLGESWQSDGRYILYAILLSIVGYFAPVFILRAYRLGDVSVITPLSKSYLLIVIAVSVVFFWDVLTWSKAVWMVGIIIGILLISLGKRSSAAQWGWGKFVLGAVVSWWIFFSFIPFIAPHLPAVQFTLLIEATVFSCALIETCIRASRLWTTNLFQSETPYFQIFLVGLFWAFGTLGVTYGATLWEFSLVATFAAAAPIVAILWSFFLHKERLTRKQWLAVALIIVSTIVLSYFS
mgnify:CR=1 FL=1